MIALKIIVLLYFMVYVILMHCFLEIRKGNNPFGMRDNLSEEDIKLTEEVPVLSIAIFFLFWAPIMLFYKLTGE